MKHKFNIGWHPSPAPSTASNKTQKPLKSSQASTTASNPEKIKIKVLKEVVKPQNVDEEITKIAEQIEDKLLLQISGVDPTIELSKKLKRIRKKIREVEILEEKVNTGEITPEKDQLEKIARKKKFEEVKRKVNISRSNLTNFYYQEIAQMEKEREYLRKLK